MKRILLLLLLLALTATPMVIRAQSGGDYDLSWNTVGGGGGTTAGGDYDLFVTLAQPGTGQANGGDYTLAGGFLGGGSVALPPARLFLPLIRR